MDKDPYFDVGDAELRAMATRRPIRVPRVGKADIGGRIRVAEILSEAGINNYGTPRRIAGATNEVWRAGEFIIRVSFIPEGNRLRRESILAGYLPAEVRYPEVIASGEEDFGEWIVVRHSPGEVLSEAWMKMDAEARKGVVEQLCVALKAVHSLWPSDDVVRRLAFPEGEGPKALPHQLPADRILELIEEAKGYPYMDQRLLGRAAERTAEAADSIDASEPGGFVHGDLHFENILVSGGEITAILDFEWSRRGIPEIDVDVLARFLHEPHLHVGGEYAIDESHFRDVLRWMCEFYPELFGHPRFVDRMLLCGLSFEVPSLVEMPPTCPPEELHRYHPLNRLRSLLDEGTHAEHLRWEPWGEYEI